MADPTLGPSTEHDTSDKLTAVDLNACIDKALRDDLTVASRPSNALRDCLGAFFGLHQRRVYTNLVVNKQMKRSVGQALPYTRLYVAVVNTSGPQAHTDQELRACSAYAERNEHGYIGTVIEAIAFVTHGTDGWAMRRAVVADDATLTPLLRSVLGDQVVVAQQASLLDLEPMGDFSDESDPAAEIEDGWMLIHGDASDYKNVTGVSYHFPIGIPNSKQIQPGNPILCFHTAKSSKGSGRVFGVGRVGRRIDANDGASDKSATVYYDRYLQIDPPLTFEELGGDPRNNTTNAIVEASGSTLARVLHRVGIGAVELLPVPITNLTVTDVQAEVTKRHLVLSAGLIGSVLAAIRAGKHVMFTGPPGTGKTTLAEAVAAAATAADLAAGATLTTGTADWTSAETVGAYRLEKSGNLAFHPGDVLQAIDDDRWLVIDELNRADIDKAIGQLFTVLSGQAVTLPYDEASPTDGEAVMRASIVPASAEAPPGTRPHSISENWRLLATLNDRDRDLLFDMSEALMRRFAIIEVPAPSSEVEWKQILDLNGGTATPELRAGVLRLTTAVPRGLGPAIVLDVLRHLTESERLEEETGEQRKPEDLLAEAFDTYVLAHLSGEPQTVIRQARLHVAGLTPTDDVDAPGVEADDSPFSEADP